MVKQALVFVFGLVIAGQSLQAQTFFSIQAVVAEPTETFRDAAGSGFGVKGTYIRFVSPMFALTGSTGYVKWGSRLNLPSGNDYKFVSIPIHIGAKLLLSRGQVAPFCGISFGMDYLRFRGVAANAVSSGYSDSSQLKFEFSPNVGIGVFVAGPVGVVVSGSYSIIYTAGAPSKYFGLNAGLAIGF